MPKSSKTRPGAGQRSGKSTRARERVAAQRAAQARAGRRRKVALIGSLTLAAIVVAALVAWGVVSNRPSEATNALPQPVAFGRTSTPPWPAPADPSPGVKAAGLAVSPMEGAAQHFHAHLDVFVDGKEVTVPANIGIDTQSGAMSSLHTHDTSGVVHIESPNETQRYILGQLFDEWQVRLDRDQVGGLKAGRGKTLTVYVNGKKTTGNPAAIDLERHQEIALVYGPADSPFTPPSSYSFPPGQ